MNKILSVVVCFHPNKESVHKLIRVLQQYSDIAVVFNDQLQQDFGQKYSLCPKSNIGTAAAYNFAIKGIESRYDRLWLWDQDSEISQENAALFLQEAQMGFESSANYAAVAFWDKKNPVVSRGHSGFSIIERAKSSGTLLSLKHLKRVGFFDESLFLDYVDFEFFYRLRKNGFKVIQTERIALDSHTFGDIYPSIFGPIRATSAIRLKFQKASTKQLLRYSYVPITFRLWLIIRLLAWFPWSLIFKDRSARIRNLLT